MADVVGCTTGCTGANVHARPPPLEALRTIGPEGGRVCLVGVIVGPRPGCVGAAGEGFGNGIDLCGGVAAACMAGRARGGVCSVVGAGRDVDPVGDVPV